MFPTPWLGDPMHVSIPELLRKMANDIKAEYENTLSLVLVILCFSRKAIRLDCFQCKINPCTCLFGHESRWWEALWNLGEWVILFEVNLESLMVAQYGLIVRFRCGRREQPPASTLKAESLRTSRKSRRQGW